MDKYIYDNEHYYFEICDLENGQPTDWHFNDFYEALGMMTFLDDENVAIFTMEKGPDPMVVDIIHLGPAYDWLNYYDLYIN